VLVASGMPKETVPNLPAPPQMPQIAAAVTSIEPKGPIIRKNPAKVHHLHLLHLFFIFLSIYSIAKSIMG
jgi:hypothetical protein